MYELGWTTCHHHDPLHHCAPTARPLAVPTTTTTTPTTMIMMTPTTTTCTSTTPPPPVISTTNHHQSSPIITTTTPYQHHHLLPNQPLFTISEESERTYGDFGGGRPREAGGVCRASEAGDERAACRACVDEENRVLTLLGSTVIPPACILRKVLECHWRVSLLCRCCCSFSC